MFRRCVRRKRDASEAIGRRRRYLNGRGELVCLVMGALLAACSHLPIDGPHHRDITDGAVTSLVSDRTAIVFAYALVDINKNVLEHQAEVGPGSFFKTFGTRSGPAPVIRIGVGDVVQVSIFESTAGGLFIPAEAGIRPGNFVTIPPQQVDSSGAIIIPYAGSIRAAGQTIPEIQDEIVSKLSNRAIEPQVVVTLAEQNATEVTVVGDAGANKFRIRPSGERILDMISRAGGPRYPGYELFVTLQRKKRTATVYFPTLVRDPAENVLVAPGDTIYVFREQQKFVAVGALGAGGQTSGLTGQFAFEQERLSLNEAVAKAGGLVDARANPGQVFLYRIEYRHALENMGVRLTNFRPEQKLIPTVYRANFRDPSSFFFAQSFAMRHKDVIYVSNADAVEVSKFLGYIRTITSTVSGVASDIALTKSASKQVIVSSP